MFKTIRNYHKFILKITPKSGFHIGAGEPDTSPVASDAEFVRVNTPWGRTVYMPGSSLKGVFRSDAEALLKSMGKEVCDLSLNFHKKNKVIIKGDKDCGVKFDKFTEKSEDVYPNVCYSCKTFGNMKMSSVVRIEDFFPFTEKDDEKNKKEKIKEIEKFSSIRNGIKIDRYTGSTAGNALFDFEVLNGGDFYGNIILKNPEIWQVLLIYKTISNINAGFVKVGGKKSRGLGNLSIEIESVEINTKNNDGVTFTKFENKQFKDDNVTFDFGDAVIEKDLIGRKIDITQKEDIKNYFKQILDKLPGSW
jgi:CRISPR-associated RAMP protein (TIGR02581 family)